MDEIYDWIAYQTKRFELHFALIKYFPEFEVKPMTHWQQFKDQAQVVQVNEVWFDLQPICCQCKGQLDCCSQNQDRLELHLPYMKPEGLRTGSLGTLSEDETHLKVWRSIFRYFRKQTTAGMWVMNPSSKERGFYKPLRYSQGIADLHRKGLSLLPFAGGNQIFIEEPIA